MSREPTWLLPDVVLAMHKMQLAEHGGSDGIRDEGLLDSALARPRNLYAYEPERASVPALAAAYGFGIASNHPFVDGRKRTAFVAMLTFLELNGCAMTASLEDRYVTMLGVADGSIGEEVLANWVDGSSKPRDE